jgi:hypothetical protein
MAYSPQCLKTRRRNKVSSASERSSLNVLSSISLDASAHKKKQNGISIENAIAEAEGNPLVRHIISQELQVYYEKRTQALMHESSDLKLIAWQSLAQDPGLHQLVPYMVQFVQEQVRLDSILEDSALLSEYLDPANSSQSQHRRFHVTCDWIIID